MGNGVSSTVRLVQASHDPALKAKLHELGDIICGLGSVTIGNSLKAICNSPDRKESLFKAVATEINRQDEVHQLTTRHTFFQQWEKKSLSEKQVAGLAALTKGWELNDDDLQALRKSALIWASQPWLFFDTRKTDRTGTLGLIQFCSNDIEQIENVNPTRRKVDLIVMFDAIVQEVEHRRRSKRKKTHDVTVDPARPQKVISEVYSDILEGSGSPKEHRKLKRQSASGSKWAQIEPRWMVLALQGATVKSFEGRRWQPIEIKAMNAYLKVLRAWKEESLLSTAYSKILEEYHHRASLTVRDQPEEAFTATIREQGGTREGNHLPQKRTTSYPEKSSGKRRCDGRNEQATQPSGGHIPSESVQEARSAISGQGSAPRKQHTNHNPASQTLADPGANLQTQLEMTWEDDGTIHPLPEENRRSISSSSSISESTDNSPYYSDPGGAGAVECHNYSSSKQVHNGWRLSPIVELSLEEREAAQMLQQFQQQTQPTSDPPSSQQVGEMSVRNATRECPQDVPSHVPRPIVDISRQDLVRWEDDDHTSTNDPTTLNANESRPPHPATTSNLFYNGETTTNIPTWRNVVFDPDTQDMTNELWQDGFFDPDTQHPTNGLWQNVLASETSPNDSMGFRQVLPQFFPYCGGLNAQPSGF
ncbi:predicted protein [Histoplasma mississippiense (nom. inval.)]|uniref:predicted protein n=1 Tax=Ajellomyces capsulatus (strain NAm1 / WU24) TaxID=2059318 RepID=UPI000157BC22|nr:predicted protein [Histoplasma mississippiense (nom. inval.)]EDN05638.1 predicted protein [Histoplasma mississippiense (nom. inval.)]